MDLQIASLVPSNALKISSKHVIVFFGFAHVFEESSQAPTHFSCLLCAAHEQLQYSGHTDSAPGCCAWIEKGGAPRTTCKEVGEVKYATGWAARSSGNQPSTNRLLICPECPDKPLPFCCSSYNMTSHWSKAHAGLTMPQKLLEAIAVSDMEVAGVTSLGKSLSKNTRKRDEKRKMAAATEASAAKQARVAEKDAASQAALSGRGQRSARTH